MNRTLDITLPRSWKEIPLDKMRKVAGLFAQKIDQGEFFARAFLLLAPVELLPWEDGDERNVYYFKPINPPSGWKKRTVAKLTDQQMLDIAQSRLAFLLEESDLVENPLPYLSIGVGVNRQKVKSAEGLLSDCSWAQYRFAENFLSLYLITQEREFRNRFIASIYSDRVNYSDDGIIRRGYHYEMGQDNRHYLFDRVSDEEFHILLLFWNGCQKYLRSIFEHLYGNRSDGKTKHTDSYADNARNIATIMDRLKCSEPEVYAMHHTTVLEVLNRMVYESKEIEKIRNKK